MERWKPKKRRPARLKPYYKARTWLPVSLAWQPVGPARDTLELAVADARAHGGRTDVVRVTPGERNGALTIEWRSDHE